jgi:Ca2+-binding EF-hand superfamily protein
VLLALAAALPLAAAAGDPSSSPAAPTPSRDVQDLIYLGDARPVLQRLHVRVDGRPFTAGWDEYLGRLFRFFDRDGDAVLTKEEGERVPAAEEFLIRMRGEGFSRNLTASFADLDTDPVDGIVTPEELAAYYRRSGAGPLVVVSGQGPGFPADRLTDALFRHLDTDRDGQLSRKELLAAPAALRELDQDDDEMVSARELIPEPAAASSAAVVGGGGMDGSAFLFVSPEEPSEELARRLLAHYDRDGNGRLSRAEVGLSQADFDRLDTNHDGTLDAGELARFRDRPPDVEFVIRLGKLAAGEAQAEMVGRPPLVGAVRGMDGGALVLTIGDAQINLRRGGEPGPSPGGDRVRQIYLAEFKAADAQGRGYVEAKQVTSPQFALLRPVLPLADRDGDGKLTEAELLAYLDVLAEASTHCTVCLVDNRGRGLFEFLDANRDGRLGERELRTAWARLAPWDRDGDGRIARSEVPKQFQLTLGLGRPGLRAMSPGAAVPTRGPLWFRKMDRNGDGDVSPREFLGTPADFRRIDADGDGLIDAKEAERADAWFRKK